MMGMLYHKWRMVTRKRRQGDKEKGFRCPCLLVSLSPCLLVFTAWPSIFVLAASADFVEEPDAFLGLIKNLLQSIAGRRVAVLIAYFDRGALPFGDVAVVLDQLLNHFVGRRVVIVVVRDGLQLMYMRDAANGGSADAPHPLRQRVYRIQDRIGLLIQEQMVIAKVRTGDMPVVVLGLGIERRSVGDQRVQRLDAGPRLVRLEVGRRR